MRPGEGSGEAIQSSGRAGDVAASSEQRAVGLAIDTKLLLLMAGDLLV